jgi:hypothetical protein
VLSSLTERDTEKFAMKLLGECEVEAILQRLDRLTQEEARVTAAHSLEVVHGLFDNLKISMDGAYEIFTRVAIGRFISPLSGQTERRQAMGYGEL